ncbi:MAG: C69 family dipeptidase [Candidatus Lokiarchaeota archaeon]|nr:C69 family dipeptidase [Candidatus Lokiarchaeota archaeon]
MCDTLVALGNSTRNGSVIFGKNSDRPSNEVQLVTHSPSKSYSKQERVRCTYITIPQARKTSEIFLSQPWWMWGAEMGANEHGVVIGNEAVYSQEELNETGLLGMDLLRLGLERGTSAQEALKIICELLSAHGQGGGCAYDDPNWTYHNSFIIADAKEAFVLETAGRWWVAEIVKTVRSISNNLSIRGKGDFRSEGIIQHAINKGYCKDDEDFDFALTFTGRSYLNDRSPFSRGGKSRQLLEVNKSSITQSKMMSFLRDHNAGICMHGAFESTGSQVSEINLKNTHIHWFTGSTLPCLSNFKPYIFPNDNKNVLKPGPYKNINRQWFWSKHDAKINRFKENSTNLVAYMNKLNKIEKETIQQVDAILSLDLVNNSNKIQVLLNKINSSVWKASEELIEML